MLGIEFSELDAHTLVVITRSLLLGCTPCAKSSDCIPDIHLTLTPALTGDLTCLVSFQGFKPLCFETVSTEPGEKLHGFVAMRGLLVQI